MKVKEITIIGGLCGCGKTTYAATIKTDSTYLYDDVLTDSSAKKKLVSIIILHERLVVTDPSFVLKSIRDAFTLWIQETFPEYEFKINYVFFENNLELANRNCEGRDRKVYGFNRILHKNYSFPDSTNLVILPIKCDTIT